jgi:hypothetical protein
MGTVRLDSRRGTCRKHTVVSKLHVRKGSEQNLNEHGCYSSSLHVAVPAKSLQGGKAAEVNGEPSTAAGTAHGACMSLCSHT